MIGHIGTPPAPLISEFQEVMPASSDISVTLSLTLAPFYRKSNCKQGDVHDALVLLCWYINNKA